MFEIEAYKDTDSHGFGMVAYPGGGERTVRQSDIYQLLCLVKGRARLILNDREYDINSLSLIFLAPGDIHALHYRQGTFSRLAWLDYHRLAVSKSQARQLAQITNPIAMSRVMEQQVDILLAYDQEFGSENDHLFDLQMQAAWQYFLHQVRNELLDQSAVHPGVDKARAYIVGHFAENIELADIARHAHLAPEYLVRLFKAAGYPSPVDYLWQTRVDRALLLLRCSDLTLDEIAGQTGFKNPYHFSRRIKSATGLPPRQYRLRHSGAMGL